jgi:AP-3 complex subunit beta
VRKTAAHSVGKIFQIDPEVRGELEEVVERLLCDKVTQVLSSAIHAWQEICPDRLDMLHQHYRKLCHLLADLDDWGQMTALSILTRYARTQFTDPALQVGAAKAEKEKKKAGGGKGKGKDKGGKKKKKNFYSSDEESGSEGDDGEEGSSEEEEDSDAELDGPKLAEDHKLLLAVSLPLLRSRSSGVVLAVASLHHYVGAKERLTQAKIGRALVRIMRSAREVQYIVLTNIVTFAREAPDLFRKYLKDFFVAVSAPGAAALPSRSSGSVHERLPVRWHCHNLLPARARSLPLTPSPPRRRASPPLCAA